MNLVFFALTGCVSPPKVLTGDSKPAVEMGTAEFLCNPNFERVPASLNCSVLFGDREFSPSKILDALPTYFEELKREHGVEYKDLVELTDSRHEPRYMVTTNTGAKLFDLLQKGNSVAKTYLKLGYEITQVPEREAITGKLTGHSVQILKPPQNLQIIFEKIYEQMFALVSKNDPFDELILPSLIFERHNKQLNTFEYLLVRPGIDPMPQKSQGWQVATSGEIDARSFAKFVAEGKMPFSHKMHHHDLAHISDFITNPKLMKLIRKYFKMEYEATLGVVESMTHKASGHYLNEFLMFPHLEMRSSWNKFFSDHRSNKQSRRERLLHQLDNGDLFKRISYLETNFLKLFSLHGGGSLDGRSLTIFPFAFGRFGDWIIAKMGGAKLQANSEIHFFLIEDSYFGLVEQMKLMSILLRDDSSALSFYDSKERNLVRHLTPATRINLQSSLVDLMEKFETKVESSLSHEMSAEQLFEDMTSSTRNFQQTHSYQHFLETSRPGGLEYELFVEGRFMSRKGP